MATIEKKSVVLAAEPTKYADGNVLFDYTTGAGISLGFTPTEITTKTTTLIKSGAGMIGSIIVNKTGATDVVTVYDALTATGTPIATITTATVGMKFCEGYKFTTGCCVVTSGGTAGAYTVAWV